MEGLWKVWKNQRYPPIWSGCRHLSTQVRFVGFRLRPFLRTEAAGPKVPEPGRERREQKKQTWGMAV